LIDQHDATLIQEAQIIPKRAVEDFIAWTLRDLRTLIPRLRQSGAHRVFILGTPGQRKDIEFHAQKLLATDFARNFASSLNFDVDFMMVTPNNVLRKLWASIQAALYNIACETGAIFVSVPPESIDNEGFLCPDFYQENDLSHANGEYGLLMIRRTMDLIRGEKLS
jgi:hypothetical protein